MALLTALSISQISDLENEARLFESHAEDLHNITNHMFDVINSINSQWEGAAHDAFVGKFNGLHDEMEHIYMMTMDYVSDLLEIAANYRAAEQDNESIAAQLNADIQLLDF